MTKDNYNIIIDDSCDHWLSKCPKCGNIPGIYIDPDVPVLNPERWYVQCDCGVKSRKAQSKDAAIATWNLSMIPMRVIKSDDWYCMDEISFSEFKLKEKQKENQNAE